MHPVGVIFIILIILVLGGCAGFYFLSLRRARQLGLPNPSLNPITLFKNRNAGNAPSYPTPRSGGVVGWVQDKITAFKYRRSATGSYESTGMGGTGGGTGTRARGAPLDPDEAWDARVGNEVYYEEQELGLQGAGATPYGGSGYGVAGSGNTEYFGEDRGRSRTRELDERYDEEMGRGGRGAQGGDPFGDGAERSNMSLRGVSPRPHEEGEQKKNSPTERRSLFRENV